MSKVKTKNEHVVLGVITVAVPFQDLADVAKAEATIRGLTFPGVRLVSCDTRLAKMPVAVPTPMVRAEAAVDPTMPAFLKR